jgi:tripartite-type tricarboxylate transporter receptor subunit TctC
MQLVRTLLSLLVAAVALDAAGSGAAAQAKFPNRPIRILIPFAAGGGTDIVARIVGQRLTEQVGQPIIIEAKPGAGGAIAVNELMRSEPDGTTLMIATSTHATLPILANLSWHPSNDFTPIAAVYSYPFALVTNSENVSHFRTLAEFLAYARMNPGKINWGSSGTGGPQHLAGEHFMKLAGIKMVHIPYRGNGPMIQALRANEVQVIFDTQTLVLPYIEEGRMTALAISATRRSAKLPNVPTIRETGLVDFSIEITNFVLAPKGLPAPIQAELNKQIATALENKEVRDRLLAFGHTVPEARENTAASVKRHIDDFAATYGTLVTELGLKSN